MRLRDRVIFTAVTQYFLVTYYLMFVSISSDYWTHDDNNHEGLWMKCSYNTNISMSQGNETSLYNITCCSSRPFKEHIGAAGFFLILQLLFDAICLILWFIYLFSDDRHGEWAFFGVYINIVSSCFFMIIVLSAYGGKGSKPLGWSFYLLLSVLFLRIPCYIVLCKCIWDGED